MGSAALLYLNGVYLNGGSDGVTAKNSRINPHQHSCLSLSWDTFSSEATASLENGQTEACTVGFSIRNPLASDSMQRSFIKRSQT